MYRRATEGPPLREPASAADTYAEVYRRSVAEAVVVAASAGDDLVGVVYGVPWRWADEPYQWAVELRRRLGTAADLIDDSFAVCLLAVLLEHQRHGLGTVLLTRLLGAAGSDVAWLATTDRETPARRLYRRLGWQPLGPGPDAPDGRPALILTYREQASP